MTTGDASVQPAAGSSAAWRTVSRGFTLIIAAILGQIPATLLASAAFGAAIGLVRHPGDFFDRYRFGELEANDWTAVVLVALALGITLLLPLIGLGGKLLCGSAPTRGATRGCAYGSAACDGLVLFGNFFYYVVIFTVASNARSERDLQSIPVATLGFGCFLSIFTPMSFVLFMVYLFKIATALDSAPLRGAAKRFLVVFGIVFGGSLLVGCLTGGGIAFVVNNFRPREGEPILAVVVIVALLLSGVLSLAAFIAYLWLLFQARSVTATAGRGNLGLSPA